MLTDYIHKKHLLITNLTLSLPNGSIRKARRDPHAWRPPRSCGLTVHPGVGCEWNCAYCYVYAKGSAKKVTPYPLSAEEILLSVASNPYVVIGQEGTPLAFGAITEPFLPQIAKTTLDYLSALSRLGNPIQISTKQALDDKTVDFLANLKGNLNVLVSLISSQTNELEPLAPSPADRIKTIRLLSEKQIPVFAFVRPIIPEITDADAENLAKKVKEAGARGVVFGSLRVNNKIFSRLKLVGVDVTNYLRKPPGDKQEYIDDGNIRDAVKKAFEEEGLEVLPSACSATVVSCGQGCWACEKGPCGNQNKIPIVDKSDVSNLAEALEIEGKTLKVTPSAVVMEGVPHKKKTLLKWWVRALTKRQLIVV